MMKKKKKDGLANLNLKVYEHKDFMYLIYFNRMCDNRK